MRFYGLRLFTVFTIIRAVGLAHLLDFCGRDCGHLLFYCLGFAHVLNLVPGLVPHDVPVLLKRLRVIFEKALRFWGPILTI